MFKKGQRVVRIIKSPVAETGTIHTVVSVNRTGVRLDSDTSLRYDRNTGAELDPAPGFLMAGISSRLVVLED